MLEMRTDRLILRDYKRSDWKDVYEFTKLSEVAKYDTWEPLTKLQTRQLVDAMIAARTGARVSFDYAIVLEGKVIGGVGIRLDCHNSVVGSINFVINPAYQGSGYATEAAAHILMLARVSLSCKVIYGMCDIANASSYNVLSKIGMSPKDVVVDYHGGRDFYRYEIS